MCVLEEARDKGGGLVSRRKEPERRGEACLPTDKHVCPSYSTCTRESWETHRRSPQKELHRRDQWDRPIEDRPMGETPGA